MDYKSVLGVSQHGKGIFCHAKPDGDETHNVWKCVLHLKESLRLEDLRKIYSLTFGRSVDMLVKTYLSRRRVKKVTFGQLR